MSLDVSCIEVARILLLKEDGIEFEESYNTLGKYVLTVNIDTNNNAIDDTNYKYIKEIRDTSIKIIKNRKYTLSQRLYMLGSFLEITRRELCYNYNEVIQFMNGYNINSFSEEFKRDKTNYMLMMLVRFSYIRFYLVEQYLYSGEITKENVIKSIQSLSKEIEHDEKYLKDILKFLKENELDNIRFASILLKRLKKILS